MLHDLFNMAVNGITSGVLNISDYNCFCTFCQPWHRFSCEGRVQENFTRQVETLTIDNYTTWWYPVANERNQYLGKKLKTEHLLAAEVPHTL